MNPERIADALFKEVSAYVARRLERLEERITALESGGAQFLANAYRGTFRDDGEYRRGELVTHQGGLWICNVDTTDRPGSGPHWTLCVKSGAKGS